METKKFLRLTSVLAFFFKVTSLFGFAASLLALTTLFTQQKNWLSYQPQYFSFFTYSKVHTPLSGQDERFKEIITVFVAVFAAFIFGLAFLKISQLFKSLAQGETPFALSKVKILKKVGWLFVLLGLTPQLLYYPLLALMTHDIYVTFGLSSELIIGLILLVAAEVFRYGLHLQEFSEDVV